MAHAGCVGIDFTGDSGSGVVLRTYRQQHSREDVTEGVRLCRENNIAVMVDLLLGGPGETGKTFRETIDFIKQVNPDCIGSILGMRLYPGTAAAKEINRQFESGSRGGIRRKYDGPLDLLKPTFYISQSLGEKPAEFVRDLIGGDKRFFEPALESDFDTAQGKDASDGYNYNENMQLENAIKDGARGAYWDILRGLR
jgi:radical SAM superfamily enzyme YgiQ (UPF0313 family)